MKKRKTNRNLWSQREENVLIKCINESGSINKGSETTSRIIDRSEGACKGHYYYLLKYKEEILSSSKEEVVSNVKEVNSNMIIDIRIENDSIFITKTTNSKVVKMKID